MTIDARVNIQPPTAAPFRDLWRVIDVIFRVDTSITLHKLSQKRRDDGDGDAAAGAARAASAALERRPCR